MSLSLAPEITIGRDAGWILAFHQIIRNGIAGDPSLEITRDDYYAEISASLPSGLEGGSYSFVVEGMTDDDYKTIALNRPDAPRILRLYLYYRDLEQPDFGIGTNLLGSDFIGAASGASKIAKHKADLVAELWVTSITRRAGERKYETSISARELVYDLVSTRRPCGEPIDLRDAKPAVAELMRRAWPFPDAAVPHEFHQPKARLDPPPEAPPAETEEVKDEADARQTIDNALQHITSVLEERNNRHGRGMFLIRDGKLHVGQRPVPLDSKNPLPKPLTLSQGLLEVETLDPLPIDPNYDPCEHNHQPETLRPQFRLILRGRPDIKPGDVVAFDCPTADVSNTSPVLGGALGALGDLGASVVETVSSLFGDNEMKAPVQLYVSSVDHKLGRATGFMTTVSGVKVGEKEPLALDTIWDAHTPAPEKKAETPRAPVRGSVEEEAADSVVRLVRREVAKLASTDIAEIRATPPQDAGPTQPLQTSTLFRGLTPLPGRNQSRRADIKRPSDAPADGVPYLTPFAWGRCGLVLPRYAGMRVAVTHRGFEGADPIDIGALWQTGHGPSDALSTDWWLSLPAESPEGNAPDQKKSGAPDDYGGKVTHDLIDDIGNRVIEVGALVIRIGKQRLHPAGVRPIIPPESNSVTIEHPEQGAKIQIREDGTIVIQGKKIEIKADTELKMSASTVQVNCQSMEVK